MVGDPGDVVEVGQLVGRCAERGDARVRDGKAREDGDDRPEHHPVEVPFGGRDQLGRCHGNWATLSARTQTVSG